MNAQGTYGLVDVDIFVRGLYRDCFQTLTVLKLARLGNYFFCFFFFVFWMWSSFVKGVCHHYAAIRIRIVSIHAER